MSTPWDDPKGEVLKTVAWGAIRSVRGEEKSTDLIMVDTMSHSRLCVQGAESRFDGHLKDTTMARVVPMLIAEIKTEEDFDKLISMKKSILATIATMQQP
jgi:hypothetical protein